MTTATAHPGRADRRRRGRRPAAGRRRRTLTWVLPVVAVVVVWEGLKFLGGDAVARARRAARAGQRRSLEPAVPLVVRRTT